MNKRLKCIVLICIISGLLLGCSKANRLENGPYLFPDESESHQATWLIWPHKYYYEEETVRKLDPIWIQMTYALTWGEKVKVVAYNNEEKVRIENLLDDYGVDMKQVSFFIHKTEDVWARDTGPLFVKDHSGDKKILDFAFNGWGEKVPFINDSKLAKRLSKDIGAEYVKVHELVMEPGAMELDGKGTFIATRSSIINENRNPGLSEKDVENILESKLGIEKFIWLDGQVGMDITDFHIDGFVKFYECDTIITMQSADLIDWGLSQTDIERLDDAKDAEGKPYEFVYLPLTSDDVLMANGENLGYKGSYVNYYVANEVVLVPFYNDPNDQLAQDILQDLYPDRRVVGIDVRELYVHGGMIHCVTQQEPY